MKSRLWIYIGLLFTMIVWSYSYVLIKVAYAYNITPKELVFIRLVLASAILFAFSKITKKLQRISKKDILPFLLLALFEPFLYYIGESNAMLYVSPTIGAVVISTIPVFVPFTMFFLFSEKINKSNFFGIIISFIGVCLVILDDNYNFSVPLKGFLFLVFTVASAMGYSVVIRNLTQKYNSYTIVAYQMGIGAVFYSILLFFSDFDTLLKFQLSWQLIASTLVLAIFATGICYIIFSSGVREIGIVKSSVFANLIPVFTAIMAFLSGMESLPMRKLSGVIIVILGVFMSQSKKSFLGIPGFFSNHFGKKK